MAHTKSAIRQIRVSKERHQRNQAKKTLIKSRRRKLDEAIAAKDVEAAKAAFSELCSALDKAAKIGSIKKETATRRKGRASERLRKISAA